MRIQLSDHFTYKKLLRFTLPSIVMMVFTSVYGVVDGLFVSNFVGKAPFAAVNFIMPFLLVLGAFGFMFGTGGSALIAKTLGEGDKQKANRYFSLFVYVSFAFGILLAVLGVAFLRPVAKALGAGRLLEDCVTYGRIILIALPAYMLQMEFQSFFITAEKPTLGLIFTLVSGVTNMALDALFIVGFRWGVAGAATATAISQTVGGIGPLFYFFMKNGSLLRLQKTKWDGRALLKTCANGSSELMSNISMSIVSMLYNAQLMKYDPENGVAAYGVLMYVCMIFLAIFIGFSVGEAPVISYHYGAKNYYELRSLKRKSLFIIIASSLCMFGLAEGLAAPLSLLFSKGDQAFYELTRRGFFIFSFSFLFSGMAIFSSSFFTALNDGLTSAIISFLRTLVFQIAAVLLLPLVMGMDGIWLSLVVAEAMALTVGVVFLILKRKKYHY